LCEGVVVRGGGAVKKKVFGGPECKKDCTKQSF